MEDQIWKDIFFGLEQNLNIQDKLFLVQKRKSIVRLTKNLQNHLPVSESILLKCLVLCQKITKDSFGEIYNLLTRIIPEFQNHPSIGITTPYLAQIVYIFEQILIAPIRELTKLKSYTMKKQSKKIKTHLCVFSKEELYEVLSDPKYRLLGSLIKTKLFKISGLDVFEFDAKNEKIIIFTDLKNLDFYNQFSSVFESFGIQMTMDLFSKLSIPK